MAALPFGETVVVDVEAPFQRRATLVFVHGLGDAPANSWAPCFRALRAKHREPSSLLHFLNEVCVVLPAAPIRPMTLNGGARCPGWYDIIADGRSRVDEPADGLEASVAYVHSLLDSAVAFHAAAAKARPEVDAVEPSRRVALAGFSQGGAVTYCAGLTYPRPLGALIALSGYICNQQWVLPRIGVAAASVPLFVGQGDADTIVLPDYARQSWAIVEAARASAAAGAVKAPSEMFWLKGVAHDTTEEELTYAFDKFLRPALAPV